MFRLKWKLYPSYLVLTAAAVLAVGILARNTLKTALYEQIELDLEQRSYLIGRLVQDNWPENTHFTPFDLKRLVVDPRLRVTIIDQEGLVIGDTDKEPESMANHKDRPEVLEAFKKGKSREVRYSQTVGQDLFYVAVLTNDPHGDPLIVRSAMSLEHVQNYLAGFFLRLFLGLLVTAAGAGVVAWFIGARLSAPIEQMAEQAKRFSEGHLKERIRISSTHELGMLSSSLNHMAAQMEQRIEKVVAQRNEHEAVLHSLAEGVLATDVDHNIISLNPSAEKLLHIQGQPMGQPLSEYVRQPAIVDALERARHRSEPVFSEVILYVPQERTVRIVAAPLKDNKGKDRGAVCVLFDITGLRKLEQVRTDFVANVSHELKTPVTAIRGYIETLLDMPDMGEDQSREFLSIITKHAERLQQIIENLLFLSRLEQPDLALDPVPLNLTHVVQRSVSACEGAASRKDMKLNVEIQADKSFEILGNGPLLEQAFVNLIDNAIKYSPEKSLVSIKLSQFEDQIQCEIRDQGEGIPAEDLNRIFERFYRVDKARNKATGGTGLGLAIVKHIVHLHNGAIDVKSAFQEGTTFILSFDPHSNLA